MNKTTITLLLALLCGMGCRSSIYEFIRNADRHVQAGDYGQAANELRMAVRYDAENPNYHYYLGLVSAYQGNYKDTVAAFDRCLELDPTRKLAIIQGYRQLLSKCRQEKPDLAVLTLKKIMNIDPHFDIGSDALLLGFDSYQQQEYRAAIYYFDQGLTLVNPDSLTSLSRYYLGRAYHETGQLNHAFDCYLQVEPKQLGATVVNGFFFQFGELCYALADSLHSSGELTRALAVLNQLLALKQPSTLIDEGFYLQGQILAEMGEYDLSIRSFERVIEFDPLERDRLVFLAKEKIKQLRTSDYRPGNPNPNIEF